MKPKISFVQLGKEENTVSAASVATGYPPLDTLLCGGLPQKFTVVLTSPMCDERDQLIRFFLKTGAEKSEPTFFVNIEPSLAGTLATEHPCNVYLFVCNSQGESMIEKASNIYVLKGVENLTNLSIALTSAIHKRDPSQKGARRICLTVLSDSLMQEGSIKTRKRLIELLTKLMSSGFTTLVMMDPKLHPREELCAILTLFEGEISIREEENVEGADRFLRVKRMKNQKFLKEEVPLTA